MTLLTLEEFKEWAEEYPELADHVFIDDMICYDVDFDSLDN